MEFTHPAIVHTKTTQFVRLRSKKQAKNDLDNPFHLSLETVGVIEINARGREKMT